jgi:hypothetical protein
MSAWPARPLKQLAEIAPGVPLRVKDDLPPVFGREYAVVSIGSLEEGVIAPVDTLPLLHLSLTDAEQVRAVLKPGFVLLSARGATLRMALVGPEHAGAAANHTLLVIRPFDEVSGPVLYAALRLPHVVHQLERISRDSTATRAWRPADVGRIAIPVPPAAVQQKVEKLIQAEERHQAAARRALALRRETVWAALGEALAGEVGP